MKYLTALMLILVSPAAFSVVQGGCDGMLGDSSQSIEALKQQLQSAISRHARQFRTGDKLSPEDQKKEVHMVLQTAANYFDATEVGFDLIDSAEKNEIALRILPSPKTKLNRMAQVIQKRFGWRFVFDPHFLMPRGGAAAIHGGNKTHYISTANLLRPGFYHADPLHELVHVREDGKVGMLMATRGKMATNQAVQFDLYQNFMRLDELEAVRWTLYRRLKGWGNLIKKGDLQLAHRGLSDVLLDLSIGASTAGRAQIYIGEAIVQLPNLKVDFAIYPHITWAHFDIVRADDTAARASIPFPLSSGTLRTDLESELRKIAEFADVTIALFQECHEALNQIRTTEDLSEMNAVREKLLFKILASIPNKTLKF